MEVRARRAGVAGMPDAGDHLAALHLLPLVKARRVGRQMRVIIGPFLVGRPFVDGDSAAALFNSFSTVPSAAAITGVPSAAMMSIAS